ncbi:uncharacterized protein LOC105841774 isoform X3 [Bombyx mori]|uniref:uncharacterized protein LOC105841774 isoform X3 n=1 Tax=Bombyx mori TaxID=7091 RepID=UPI002ED12C4B
MMSLAHIVWKQNGLAERMNRTLVERARCMLFYANLEKKFWTEAVATAAYVVNRSPTKSLEGKTPYELWKGKKPNLSHLKIFGSEAMVHVPKEKRHKWDKKSVKMIFMGYCDSSKGYRLMDPKTLKIIKSRDVIFIENVETSIPIEDNRTVTVSSVPSETEDSENSSVSREQEIHTQESSATAPLMSSKDSNIRKGDSEDSSEYDTDTGELDATYHPPYPIRQDYSSSITLRQRNKQCDTQDGKTSLLCLYSDLTDPQTVEEVLTSSQAAEWKRAMDEEYSSLMKNKTWSLTELPPGKKALPCKWVFKIKTDQNGNVTRYKARLVIKGYAQRKGTDYEETYSPVVRYTTIRYLFALTAKYGLDIDQMDAVSAFLQGEIDTEIYMVQPEQYKQGSKDGAISWRSQKQQTVALSTAEAEYMSMSSAAQEALWLQQLHTELGQQKNNPLIIFCDNQSAIKLSNNYCYLPRSKHIDIRYHFLKDHVSNLDIKYCYIKGEEMVADNLTKGTSVDKHLYCLTKMGLHSKGGC